MHSPHPPTNARPQPGRSMSWRWWTAALAAAARLPRAKHRTTRSRSCPVSAPHTNPMARPATDLANPTFNDSEQQCTQALTVDGFRSLAMSEMPRKPGCMARSRYTKQNARREEAYRRQREANDAAAAEARERAKALAKVERSAAAQRDLQLVWGGREDGLTRLRDISRQLEKLHRAEHALLEERDELVHALRRGDVSWALLSTWSGLSRQALSKRPNSNRQSSG